MSQISTGRADVNKVAGLGKQSQPTNVSLLCYLVACYIYSSDINDLESLSVTLIDLVMSLSTVNMSMLLVSC